MKNKFTRKIRTIILALVVLGVIGAIVYNAVNQSHQKSDTEFYILGSSGKVADYAVTAKAGIPVTVTLGIHNM